MDIGNRVARRGRSRWTPEGGVFRRGRIASGMGMTSGHNRYAAGEIAVASGMGLPSG